MNTPQQIAVVKAIIKIKKRILQSTEKEDIAELVQQAIEVTTNVPANANLNKLDKTKSKEWNIIALKRMVKAIREKNFESMDILYTEISAALLRLSMVFVEGELNDVNKILAESFLNTGAFRVKTT